MTEYASAEERYTVERARAVLADHAAGLHDVSDEACSWPGCDEAYWIVSHATDPSTAGERLDTLLEQIQEHLPPGARVEIDTSPMLRFGER